MRLSMPRLIDIYIFYYLYYQSEYVKDFKDVVNVK